MTQPHCTPGHRLALKLLACCAAAIPLDVTAADTEGVIPDRPGFSTGTYTLDPGQVGIELGFEMTFGNAGSPRKSTTAPLLNLRIGATQDFEIDLAWAGWTTEHTAGHTSTSAGDGMIAGKLSLASSAHANFSLLGGLTLPMGNTSGQTDPIVSFLWDTPLSNAVTAFGVLQFTSYRDDGGRHVVFQPAVGLSLALSDRFGYFVEVFGDIPLGSATQRSHMIDTGLTYLITKNLQVDLNLGFALDRRADDFIGTGLAILF